MMNEEKHQINEGSFFLRHCLHNHDCWDIDWTLTFKKKTGISWYLPLVYTDFKLLSFDFNLTLKLL